MAKERINFTKARIDGLDLPNDGKRWAWYWDTKTQGLAIRVSQAGSKVFYLYRWVGGKPQQKSLGKYPALSIENARKKAAELNGAVALGSDDLQKASRSTRGEMTFEKLFNWYFETYSKHKKSKADDEMQNRLHFQGLAKKPLSKITKADLRQLHREIAERTRRMDPDSTAVIRSGHYAANKALRLLRTIFNAAIREDLFQGPNPAIHIDWFKEQSRERRLMHNELPIFLKAVEDEPNETVRDFVHLSLLTGMRKSNILTMMWAHVDLENHSWHIPVTKNGTPQLVPLLDLELAILTRRKAQSNSPWVFPGDGTTGHMQDPRKGWLRILRRANIEGLRLHDLRRSLGSLMADAGVSTSIIGKALNHLSPASTAIYMRIAPHPVREAKQKAHGLIKDATLNGKVTDRTGKLRAIHRVRQKRRQST